MLYIYDKLVRFKEEQFNYYSLHFAPLFNGVNSYRIEFAPTGANSFLLE